MQRALQSTLDTVAEGTVDSDSGPAARRTKVVRWGGTGQTKKVKCDPAATENRYRRAVRTEKFDRSYSMQNR